MTFSYHCWLFSIDRLTFIRKVSLDALAAAEASLNEESSYCEKECQGRKDVPHLIQLLDLIQKLLGCITKVLDARLGVPCKQRLAHGCHGNIRIGIVHCGCTGGWVFDFELKITPIDVFQS